MLLDRRGTLTTGAAEAPSDWAEEAHRQQGLHKPQAIGPKRPTDSRGCISPIQDERFKFKHAYMLISHSIIFYWF